MGMEGRGDGGGGGKRKAGRLNARESGLHKLRRQSVRFRPTELQKHENARFALQGDRGVALGWSEDRST